jgi:membrane-bound serine protease (ClpP class)
MSGTLGLAFFLLVLGFLLVVAEVLFPSFGLLSVGAMACFVISVWLAFKAGMFLGITFLVVCLVLVPLFVYLGFKYVLPRSFVGRQIIHSDLVSTDGEASGTDRDLTEFVGAEGVSRSYLRPAGVADINGQRVDVVTEGGMVDKGTRVRVIDVEGNRVVVRPIEGLLPKEEAGEEA